MSKSKDKIRVSFIGNNATSVAGSMTLITWGKPQRSILVEVGLVQGEKSLLGEYQANNANFKFKTKNIDYVFMSDNHGDHCLLFPLLVKRGFKGKAFVPEGFIDIFKPMALDSANIMERNALDLTKKFKKNYPPIYDNGDVYAATMLLEECEFNKKIKIDEDITVEFVPAGHTLHSSGIILYIKNGNTIKKIAFTGDMGNIAMPKLFTNTFQPIQSSNLLISETTYADAKRSANGKNREKDIEKIKSIVYDYVIDREDGKILFPTFSFMRTQIILSILFDLFYTDEKFTCPIYVASPLACKICDVFDTHLKGEELEKWQKIRGWGQVHFVKDFETLENLLNKHTKENSAALFLASSRFMQRRYSVYLAEKLLPSSKNIIAFCGYATPTSLAGKIKQKKTKTIAINGKSVPCRANVINLQSFSSHIQHDELLKLLSGGYGQASYEKIALVHGDFDGKVKFAEELKKEISKRNRTDKVIIVNKSTEILL